MNDYLIPLIVIGGFITSSFIDGVRIDNLKEDLKKEIHAKATAKANEVKEKNFNEAINKIDKEHQDEAKDLNATPIGGTIRF